MNLSKTITSTLFNRKLWPKEERMLRKILLKEDQDHILPRRKARREILIKLPREEFSVIPNYVKILHRVHDTPRKRMTR